MAPSPGNSSAPLTPMMQRYLEVKQQTPGALLLFRMGDFYELFYEDAEQAARVLGLTLTSRDKGSTNPVPMAGFPYHALDGYLRKLVAAGFRAAICDQMEDPKAAKGMVRREVTRVITPGTLTEDALLDPRQSNFLAALHVARDTLGLAWLELSTGRFQCCDLPRRIPRRSGRPASGATANAARRTAPISAERRTPLPPGLGSVPSPAGHYDNHRDEQAALDLLFEELGRIGPAECLVSEDVRSDPAAIVVGGLRGCALTFRAPWCFQPRGAGEQLMRHFGVSTLDGFDLDAAAPCVTAAGALLGYVQEMQKAAVGHIVRLEPYRRGDSLLIDDAARRSLELTRTLRDGRRDGSLLDVLDDAATPMGARLLAEWLGAPLTDLAAINARLDAVAEFVADPGLADDVADQLRQASDVHRLTARIATLRAAPRDFAALARTLALLPRLKARLSSRRAAQLQRLEADLDLCAEVRTDIDGTLVDEPPLSVADGGVIRPGVDPALDELRDLSRGGKQWIADYQRREVERTGISSLKVGFNKVFGYYLEITAANFDRVPADYIRKQTLKNQERFITPELKEYEDKVLRAEERALALEQELFQRLRERVARECRRLQQTAETLARIDVLSSLARIAVRRQYCRPELTLEPVLDIREGRHPVLERLQPEGAFVPNDVRLGVAEPWSGSPPASADHVPPAGDAPRFLLITGPNMAGKSTYIRQTALITIMAQIGSFVPARSARIGVADRIFARVGASDELSRGHSTFMVEMTEAARILNLASDRSLVILDEIGRGTSTYDGVSLAWAITEYLHDELGCRTLFATHYHELTELPGTLPGVVNANVAVREQGSDLVFLHRIVPGAADRSYGLHVARLAGLPSDVVQRAQVILQTLEADHHRDSGELTIPARKPRKKLRARQLVLFDPDAHPVVEELRRLDPAQLSPEQALVELTRLRSQAGRTDE